MLFSIVLRPATKRFAGVPQPWPRPRRCTNVWRDGPLLSRRPNGPTAIEVVLVPSFCSIGTILPPRPARPCVDRREQRSRMADFSATRRCGASLRDDGPVLEGCEHGDKIECVGGILGILRGHGIGATSWPMAQRNPASSRATAVTTTVDFLPFAVSARVRADSRVCAFHAISRATRGARST